MLFWIIVPTSFIIFMALLLTYAYGGLKAAPWVPMRSRDLSRLDRLMPVKSTDIVYDLGCGDARTLVHMLEKGAKRAVGYEVSLIPYLLAHIRGRKYKERIDIRFQDFWKHDVSDATMIFLFLSYNAHARLGEKFMKELCPGTRIATYVWPIKGWTPKVIDKTPDDLSMFIYER